MIYFFQVFYRKWLVKQLVFLSLKSLEMCEDLLSKILKSVDTAVLFKSSTTVLEPNTAVFSGIECLLSLTKSIGAEPCRDECVLHRLNLENIQPKLLRKQTPAWAQVPGNALWNSACVLSVPVVFSACLWCQWQNSLHLCSLKQAGMGFHFSVLISAVDESQSTFCQLNQGDNIILGDLLTF